MDSNQYKTNLWFKFKLNLGLGSLYDKALYSLDYDNEYEYDSPDNHFEDQED